MRAKNDNTESLLCSSFENADLNELTLDALSFSAIRCLMEVCDWLEPGLITGRGGRSRENDSAVT